MANFWTTLKNSIKAVIKSNDAQEITGDVLQTKMVEMVDALGEYASFAGSLAPTATLPSVNKPVFYLANGAGGYGALTVGDNEIAFISNHTGSWAKYSVSTGAGGGGNATDAAHMAQRASEYGHNYREMQTVDTTTGVGITADNPIQIEMGSDEWDGGVKHTHWMINLSQYGATETVYVRINLKLNDSIYPRTDWNAWETTLIVFSSTVTKKLNVRVGTETYSKTVDLVVPYTENYIGVVVKSGGDIFLNNRTFQKQSSISVDAALSDTSTNPVQNKVVTTALGQKAGIESPAFTGTPTAPTQPKSERNTRIATTGFAYDIAEEYGFRASEYGQNYRSIGAMGGNGTMESPFVAIIGSDEWIGGLAAYNIYSGELAALDTDDNPLGEAFLKLDTMSWGDVYPEDDWNARTIACIIKNTAPAYSTLQIQVDNYDNLKTVVPLAEGMNYIEVLLEGHEEGTKLTARNTSLGEAPQFMGEAVPADEEPDEEDYFAWGTVPPEGRNCSFLAKTPGYYYHFGQTTLSEGETAIFYTVDFGSSWKKITLSAGGGGIDNGTFAPLDSPSFTGTPTAPTPAKTNNSTRIATTAFVQTNLEDKAEIDSPVFTGTPTAPTPDADSDDTRIATTEWVNGKISAGGGGTGGGGETDTFDGNKTITGNLNVGGALAVTGAVTAQSMTLGSSPVPESSDSSVPTTEWVRANYMTTRATLLVQQQSLEKPLGFVAIQSGILEFTVSELCPSGHLVKIPFLCTTNSGGVTLKIKKKATDAEEMVIVKKEAGYNGYWGFDVAVFRIAFFYGYNIMALEHCSIDQGE